MSGSKNLTSGAITCTHCKTKTRLNKAGNGCQALAGEIEDVNCLYNGGLTGRNITLGRVTDTIRSGPEVACVFCKQGYYVYDHKCQKYPDGSDPACQAVDSGNTDGNCTAETLGAGCRGWEGYYAVDSDGIDLTCERGGSILRVFFSFVLVLFLFGFKE